MIGIHLNMAVANSPAVNLKTLIGSFAPSLVVDAEDIEDFYPPLDKFVFLISETGYMHEQATKPDTLGKHYLSLGDTLH